MTNGTDQSLTIALVTASLSGREDLPDGPCVVLSGSADAVKAAALHFGESVTLRPCDTEGPQ